MISRNVRLVYPPSLLQKPILSEVLQLFKVSANILRAEINLEEGWLEIQFSGQEEEINRAIKWLKQEGITIKTLS